MAEFPRQGGGFNVKELQNFVLYLKKRVGFAQQYSVLHAWSFDSYIFAAKR